jgi:uncharacterized protein YbcV (DUF1398 family)
MFTIKEIEDAHLKVKTGADFPKYIQNIKKIGVISFETYVHDSHTSYFGKDNIKAESKPQYDSLTIADQSNGNQFNQYLKIHQQGETDYYTFCKHCSETGIEKWFANLETMTCTYYDKAGNKILIEAIPR